MGCGGRRRVPPDRPALVGAGFAGKHPGNHPFGQRISPLVFGDVFCMEERSHGQPVRSPEAFSVSLGSLHHCLHRTISAFRSGSHALGPGVSLHRLPVLYGYQEQHVPPPEH